MTAVVGAVGSGKSSLLSALLGEMKRTRGVANVFGKVRLMIMMVIEVLILC